MTAFIWKNKIAWLLALVIIGVVVDQASKIWALDALTRPATAEEISLSTSCREQAFRATHRTECVRNPRVEPHGLRVVERQIPVIDGLFNFKYAENPAAAFSMTGSLPDWFRRPFLLLISLLASLGITVWYLKMRTPDWALMTAFPLIVAGAVGNLIDRFRLAYVIDFLDFYMSSSSAAAWLVKHAGSNHWPTFNVADSCIVVGAAFVIFRTFKSVPEEDSAGDSSSSSSSSPSDGPAESSATSS